MTDESLSFEERLALKKAAREAKQAQVKPSVGASAPPTPQANADLIPQTDEYVLSEADKELDAAVDSVDILKAVVRYGTMLPKILPGQYESIKFSCVNPGHDDREPSAWLNSRENTWYCGTCDVGGDVHELAALYHGYDLNTFKTGKTFGRLRQQIAEDFGYRIERTAGGEREIIAPVYDDAPAEVAVPAMPTVIAQAEPPQMPPVLSLVPEPDDEPEEEDRNSLLIKDIPALDWRSISPDGSFLDEYMKATVIDDVPEEYHFWNGLIALGFAVGRQVRLYDTQEVYANLFVCTLGKSGSGKSKAARHLKALLGMALPYKADDPNSRGVSRISSPASAESLILAFQKIIMDPVNPKKVLGYSSVTGLVDFNELSGLVGRASRNGSVLKPTLMEFYDADPIVSSGAVTTGQKEAHQPFASALTTTQPAALRTLLGSTDDDSGFLNRWVFVAGPEKKKVAIGGARIDTTPAVAPLKRIHAWSSTFKDADFLDWSPEGAELFTEFFDTRIEPDKKASESAMLTRIDLLMKKLVLLFAINRQEKMASKQSVADALSLYDYIKACYTVPEREIRMTLSNEVADTIITTVVNYAAKHEGRGPTMRELTKLLWRRNYPNEMIVKTIETLVKLDLLDEQLLISSQPGGRKTKRYRYVG